MTTTTTSTTTKTTSSSATTIANPSTIMPKMSNDDLFAIHTLNCLRFTNAIKIKDSLQGSIWRANRVHSNGILSNSQVIKFTQRQLHQQRASCVNGKAVVVHENILKEQQMLKYLSAQPDFPATITKHQGFCTTQKHHVFIQEDGGSSLFNFVESGHKLIKMGNISIENWKAVTKIIIRQMVESIAYLHKMNVCHFDVSLENYLIADAGRTTKVKLCDFGLAESFGNKTTVRTVKFCGKNGYMSPELVAKDAKNGFDAKKNDVWCLAISMFMIACGHPLWLVADAKNDVLLRVMRGELRSVVRAWNKLTYIDDKLIHLLQRILQPEASRLSIEEIMRHPYFH